jgi:hypothetical protein
MAITISSLTSDAPDSITNSDWLVPTEAFTSTIPGRLSGRLPQVLACDPDMPRLFLFV